MQRQWRLKVAAVLVAMTMGAGCERPVLMGLWRPGGAGIV